MDDDAILACSAARWHPQSRPSVLTCAYASPQNKLNKTGVGQSD